MLQWSVDENIEKDRTKMKDCVETFVKTLTGVTIEALKDSLTMKSCHIAFHDL